MNVARHSDNTVPRFFMRSVDRGVLGVKDDSGVQDLNEYDPKDRHNPGGHDHFGGGKAGFIRSVATVVVTALRPVVSTRRRRVAVAIGFFCEGSSFHWSAVRIVSMDTT